MEIPFPILLQDDTRLLKQIVADMTANRITLEVKIYVHILAEPRRVVITVCFCIAKCFQDCI